jgi:hypothetical protein
MKYIQCFGFLVFMAWTSEIFAAEQDSELELSLRACISNLKKESSGWQSIEISLLSKTQQVDLCTNIIVEDFIRSLDKEYGNINQSDASFREVMFKEIEIDGISLTSDTAMEKKSYNQQSVVVTGARAGMDGQLRPNNESSTNPLLTSPSLPGYTTVVK